MRFELGHEALAVRDAARTLLASEATPAVVRAGWPGGDRALVDAVWRKFADSGLIGALVAERQGGLGLDENCLPPLMAELGRCGLPVPVVETVAVAAPLLAAAGHPAIDDILTGRALVAAKLDGGDLIPFGQHADLVLLARNESELWLYEPGELELAPVTAIDGSRGLARLIGVTGGVQLPCDPGVFDSAWQRGVLGTSAVLIGLADRMLDMTVSYVKQREQFGVPIGSFQAIKHALASALLALEFARPSVLAAAWGLTTGQNAAVRISMAKALASDAAGLVTRTAIQSHGAIAYTTEYDLHLFAKRVWALVPSWGGPGWHRDRLALALGLKSEAD